jgi:hypothetical protein
MKHWHAGLHLLKPPEGYGKNYSPGHGGRPPQGEHRLGREGDRCLASGWNESTGKIRLS